MAEQKTYTVNITEKAESMLEGHIRFIARVNKEAAHAHYECDSLFEADATTVSIY